jgi:hypothetical protein
LNSHDQILEWLLRVVLADSVKHSESQFP